MIPTVKLEQKKKVTWADIAYLERGLVLEQRLEMQHSFAEHKSGLVSKGQERSLSKDAPFSEQRIKFSNKPFLDLALLRKQSKKKSLPE